MPRTKGQERKERKGEDGKKESKDGQKKMERKN